MFVKDWSVHCVGSIELPGVREGLVHSVGSMELQGVREGFVCILCWEYRASRCS